MRDNEFLHSKDGWYIIHFVYDGSNEDFPPFALVYYRGNNDAWGKYGRVVTYTRDAALLEMVQVQAINKRGGADFCRCSFERRKNHVVNLVQSVQRMWKKCSNHHQRYRILS